MPLDIKINTDGITNWTQSLESEAHMQPAGKTNAYIRQKEITPQPMRGKHTNFDKPEGEGNKSNELLELICRLFCGMSKINIE